MKSTLKISLLNNLNKCINYTYQSRLQITYNLSLNLYLFARNSHLAICQDNSCDCIYHVVGQDL